jgi:hypothetical protein
MTFILLVSLGAETDSVSKLLEQGQTALVVADFKSASDDFSDVLTLDPHNQLALEGRSLAYLELGEFPNAHTDLERLLNLSNQISRSTAINGAALFLVLKNPMRSVRLLMQYMRPLTSPDEQAVNALMIALAQADEQARKARLFADASKFADNANTQLEALRPGMKRWGIEWVSVDVAKANEAALAASRAALAKDQQKLHDDQLNLVKDEQDYNGRMYFVQRSAAPPNYADEARARCQTDATQIAADQTAIKQDQSAIQEPPLPKAITPVGLHSGAVTAIAAGHASPGLAPQAVASTATPAGISTVPAAPTTPSAATPAASTAGTPPAANATDASTASPAATSDATQPPTPKVRLTSYAAAFPVAPTLLVTAAAVVEHATQIQLEAGDGSSYTASLLRSDPESGLALIQVSNGKFNYLGLGTDFAGGAINCVSFPSVDLFQPAAASITGSAIAPRTPWHLRLGEPPRLPGGPILTNGKVVGVELAQRESDVGMIPAATLGELRKLLGNDAPAAGSSTDAVAVTLQVVADHEK